MMSQHTVPSGLALSSPRESSVCGQASALHGFGARQLPRSCPAFPASVASVLSWVSGSLPWLAAVGRDREESLPGPHAPAALAGVQEYSPGPQGSKVSREASVDS